MNNPVYSQPPRDLPVYVKLLLGLPSDATREEIANEWNNQVVPLLAAGPKFLWDREVTQMMSAGVAATKVHTIFKQTRRGAMLFDSIDREAKARVRQQQSKPPFAK